ncbi:MAG: glucuronate isomerase, partial [Roseibium sp.]
MSELNALSESLYQDIRQLPIVSPHGHCAPEWFADDLPFANAAELMVIPDHYVFRMLYSQGVSLAELGIGGGSDPRTVFQRFADNWHLFLGTPSRTWIEFVLQQTLGISTELSGHS